MRIKAFAKLNLGLTVTNKRADGYHDLKMVTVPIDLFDVLYIDKRADIQISTNKWYLPNNEKNTIYQTLKLLEQECGIDPNYHIKVIKNIPTQAGMGGGSSDSGTLLNYLDESLDLGLSVEKKIELGLQIGADVPYFIVNQPAIVSGIGEIIEPIKVNCPFHLFIVKPKQGISTPALFKKFKMKEQSDNSLDKLVYGLTHNDYEMVVSNLKNDLLEAATLVHPEINDIISDLMRFGFDGVSMTGAGSTIFGITQDENLVRDAVMSFFEKYDLVKKTKIV